MILLCAASMLGPDFFLPLVYDCVAYLIIIKVTLIQLSFSDYKAEVKSLRFSRRKTLKTSPCPAVHSQIKGIPPPGKLYQNLNCVNTVSTLCFVCGSYQPGWQSCNRAIVSQIILLYECFDNNRDRYPFVVI